MGIFFLGYVMDMQVRTDWTSKCEICHLTGMIPVDCRISRGWNHQAVHFFVGRGGFCCRERLSGPQTWCLWSKEWGNQVNFPSQSMGCPLANLWLSLFMVYLLSQIYGNLSMVCLPILSLRYSRLKYPDRRVKSEWSLVVNDTFLRLFLGLLYVTQF